jgi:hypothetical protein
LAQRGENRQLFVDYDPTILFPRLYPKEIMGQAIAQGLLFPNVHCRIAITVKNVKLLKCLIWDWLDK